MHLSRTALVIASIIFMSNCGMVEEPPSEYSFLLRCPTCRASGVDTIDVHNPSVVLRLAVDTLGMTHRFVLDGATVSNGRVWFGSHGLPLLVSGTQEPNDSSYDVRLEPFDWGPSAQQDSNFTAHVRDPHPQDISWHTQFIADNSLFSYRFQLDTTIPVSPDGSYSLNLPKLLFAHRPPQAYFWNNTIYRGMYISQSNRIDSLSTLHVWPPRSDSGWMPSSEITCWKSDWSEKIQHQICVTGKGALLEFHRSWAKGWDVVGEDSGSWDPISRKAVFVHREPSGEPRSDSTIFDPRPVPGTANWWYTNEPALESVARSGELFAWTLFKAP
ncbi:MAG: hypothetical protein IPO40_01170 [Fibrobacteres bacterium]|nr:hypothetical protein [Fibrobacterota bacterium]